MRWDGGVYCVVDGGVYDGLLHLCCYERLYTLEFLENTE